MRIYAGRQVSIDAGIDVRTHAGIYVNTYVKDAAARLVGAFGPTH